MQRVCFQLQVKPDRLEEYKARHRAVWPEMLEALAATGWHNYSLFLGEDGLLIGYFETPSLEDALAGMAATEVNAPLAGRDGGVLRGPGRRTPGHRFPPARGGLPPGGPARRTHTTTH